jgi:UDP-N-acetylmuramate--alanine ligase
MAAEVNSSVYFLGIGGIGMSALARYFLHQGYAVFGYDKVATPITDQLTSEGAELVFDEAPEAIPDSVRKNRNTQIIYTPAIPHNHPHLVYLRNHQFNIQKRAEALAAIVSKYPTIAIAGTHGKTTTSAMVAHLLHHAGVPTLAFVGGILTGYNSNVILDPDPQWVVVEADEYDRSFLQLKPDAMGITTIDADHLDIYSDQASIQEAFDAMVKRVKNLDEVVVNETASCLKEKKLLFYGTSKDSAIRILDRGTRNPFQWIHIEGIGKEPFEIEIALPGLHNALNAVLASTLCFNAGLTIGQIQSGMRSFKGVKRRFEYILQGEKTVFIDDYAHHPKEINALIHAVRELYPSRKLTGIFQPHLYSRTRDFMEEFASSLSELDELFLMEIYPARELPIPGITSSALLKKVTINQKSIVDKESLMVLLQSNIPDILLTIGAGDIGLMVPAVKEAITN